MKLSNLTFAINYNSYENDVVNDFYIKALSNAKNYDRVSAYFDSKILALYATAIENIYNINGKIRFIFSQELTDEDFNLMLSGYTKRSEEVLMENFKRFELTELEKNKLSNLAFLIEQGVVDIKIAFTKSGILHDKFGLIYNDDDYIFFRGSNNETVASIKSNHESFEVSCSWYNEPLENQKINKAITTFSEMWNNICYGMCVVNVPEVLKNELAKYNKGKIIFNPDYFNAVVADLNEYNVFVVRNNLEYHYEFDKDFDYKNYIKKYVSKIENNIIYFDNRINYLTINNIIKKFEESQAYNNYNFIVTKRLRDYLEEKNIQIDKRKELGKLIKTQALEVSSEFDKFKIVVDNEMTRKLRDKQMWDSFFIVNMIKSANYSVPGAGKTSIVYGAFSYLNSKNINLIDKIIMIGPKNSFKSWKDEFVKCFGLKKKLNVLNIQDSKFNNAKDKISALRFDSANKNLILINYDLLPTLSDVLNEIIDSRVLLVFDEVHKVKAIGGVWATEALDISKNAKYKVILTGTPMPNSYLDLYNQLNILFTDEYKTFFKFSISDLKNPSEAMIKKINYAIYPFFCRTTKKDLMIPKPNEDIKIISWMNENERTLFSILRKKYSKNGLTLYIRLLQASTNPKLLLGNLDSNILSDMFSLEEDDLEDNVFETYNINQFNILETDEINLIKEMDMTTKFWDSINLVKKLVMEGKQVLVWAIFVNTIDRFKEELQKIGISAAVIYGQTPLNERELLIEEFKAKHVQVIITNPHTLAESVSLHETCHDAVYLEYSFNLTHMLQSKDRINRLGLDDNQYTQYYYMFLYNSNPDEDSIDLKTYDRLKEKENEMIKAIEGDYLEAVNFDMLEDIIKILNIK